MRGDGRKHGRGGRRGPSPRISCPGCGRSVAVVRRAGVPSFGVSRHNVGPERMSWPCVRSGTGISLEEMRVTEGGGS